MGTKETEFKKRLLSTFKIEAQEHIAAISSGLVRLEKKPSPEEAATVVETVFRAVHSLKGAARAVNSAGIELICQSLESVFAVWKRSGLTGSEGAFDALYKGLEAIRSIVSTLDAEKPNLDAKGVTGVIEALSGFESAPQTPASQSLVDAGEKTSGAEEVPVMPAASAATQKREAPSLPLLSDTIRIPAGKLNSLLLKIEEMLTFKERAADLIPRINEVSGAAARLKKELARSPAGASENPLSGFKLLEAKLSSLESSAKLYNRSLDRMVERLLEDMKTITMLPFSSLLEAFPVLVRELAREHGKDAELTIKGADLEIDRRILEEIKDPLVHIIRNSIDHGIERPEARKRLKKPVRGKIDISVSHITGGIVELKVSDDGSGIDIPKVKDVAVRNNILSRADADALTEKEAAALVFRSGFSTSPIITDISGRGLGLAIALENTERLGGSLDLETSPNAGTSFRLKLPLTIATFRGILINASGNTFIIPTSGVERTLRVKKEEIRTVENRETVMAGGKPVSFARLANVLELPAAKSPDENRNFVSVIVVNLSDKRIAFGVDEVLGEQEVLLKGLGKQLPRVRNIAGAALLWSGKPVPVLNIPDLLRSALKSPQSARPAFAPAPEKGASLLVVEDSITSRILLKNILESSGYNVKTAVDGIDAMTLLKMEEFDLVVSDVDMPRMNGFDLALKVRSDKRLANLPFILVTALDSREDRERGIEVGANAYIVKSSFDQGNLLEIIQRLL